MTPINVKVDARQVADAKAFADKIKDKMEAIPYLRDVRIAESVDYPVLEINVDRDFAGQFGLSVEDVKNSMVTATSSTRFTNKNMWIDPNSRLPFQTHVALPHAAVATENQLRTVPLTSGSRRPILEDVATLNRRTSPARV